MSFFRTAIYICIGLILFSLFIGFVNGLNAFSVDAGGGVKVSDKTALEALTGLSNGWDGVWLLFVSITGIGAVALAYVTGQFAPISIYVFGTVFWTAYTHAFSVINANGFIPSDFLLIVNVVVLFIFIAACIGISGIGD